MPTDLLESSGTRTAETWVANASESPDDRGDAPAGRAGGASEPRGRIGAGILLAVSWAALVLTESRKGEPPVGLAAIALMAGWLAVFALAAWGGGILSYRAILRRSPDGFDEGLIALAAGTGVLAAAAALLGAVGALRAVPLIATLACLALVGAVSRPRRPRPRIDAAHVPSAWILPLAVVAAAGLLTLLSVTADSAFYDQLHYHLAFPAQWLRAGRLLTFPRHDYSYYPAGMGLLYVYPLSSFGPWAAQAVHWSFGLLAVVAAARLAFRLAGTPGALWSAAVVAVVPAVMWTSTVAGNDLGAAGYGAAGWLALAIGLESADRDRTRFWILAGLLAGLAAGAKLLGVLTVGMPLFCVLALAPGGWPLRARRLASWSIGAAIPLVPWLLRNEIVIGNPVFPFLATLFGHGPEAAAAAHRSLSQGAIHFMSDPLRVLTLGALGPLDGSVGPVPLLLLPLAVWCGVKTGRLGRLLLVGCGIGILGWAIGPSAARYVIPVLFPLAALAGAGVVLLSERLSRRARLALTLSTACVCAWSLLQGVDHESAVRIGVTLGREPTDAALRRWASYWPAVPIVNALPATSRVLFVAESRTFYFDRDVVFEDALHTPLIGEIAERAGSAEDIAADLRARGITHVLLNGIDARRIAAWNGRDEYFGGLTNAARARIQAFLSDRAERVWTENGVELYALK